MRYLIKWKISKEWRLYFTNLLTKNNLNQIYKYNILSKFIHLNRRPNYRKTKPKNHGIKKCIGNNTNHIFKRDKAEEKFMKRDPLTLKLRSRKVLLIMGVGKPVLVWVDRIDMKLQTSNNSLV